MDQTKITTIMTNTNAIMTKFFNKVKASNSLEYILNINDKSILFFTDGSCTKNGNKTATGGFSIICVAGYKKNLIMYGKLDNTNVKSTNIRAEGTAIMLILEMLAKEVNTDNWNKWNKCCIYTDSEFWIKMIYAYMPKWTTFMFQTKANPDLTQRIWHLWNELIDSKNIEIIHVYAHNKDKRAKSTDAFARFTFTNNELADELATIARTLPNYKIISKII